MSVLNGRYLLGSFWANWQRWVRLTLDRWKNLCLGYKFCPQGLLFSFKEFRKALGIKEWTNEEKFEKVGNCMSTNRVVELEVLVSVSQAWREVALACILKPIIVVTKIVWFFFLHSDTYSVVILICKNARKEKIVKF